MCLFGFFRGAPDLLVALHACGGLSDAVIASALLHQANFLVCCCCFLKHPNLRNETLIPLLIKGAPPAVAQGLVCLLCAAENTYKEGPCPHRAHSCRGPPKEPHTARPTSPGGLPLKATACEKPLNNFNKNFLKDFEGGPHEGGAPKGPQPPNDAASNDTELQTLFR